MVSPAVALLIAGGIAVVLLVLFWPRRGLIPRWRQAQRMTLRIRSEDALKHLYKCEMGGRSPSMASIAGTLHINLNDTTDLIHQMEIDGLVVTGLGEIALTDNGRDAALHIIRAHRLWERYLAEETGYGEQEWHEQAEQWEHALTLDEANALSVKLGNPHFDPHGDPIPTAAGDIRGHGGHPLPRLEEGATARIVHLEDEPEAVYAQLLAEGLHLGQIVRVSELRENRIRFWSNGDEHLLAPIIAANISVVPLEISQVVDKERADSQPLSSLEPGQTAEVVGISPSSRGMERRRFLDLGILPGTRITAEFESPSGNPMAYKIRGATIALRRNQAQHIKVRPLKDK
jgi:DtxR family Mn-dependent transcriptional regulator